MTNLHVEQHGRDSHPSTVVLLSSIGTTGDAWAKQIPVLAHDHRVITVDHRGHGGSETPNCPPGTVTVQQLAEDILAALDAIGVARFHLVGLSLGGALAQWIAANTNRVDKAVFACTATYLGGDLLQPISATVAAHKRRCCCKVGPGSKSPTSRH